MRKFKRLILSLAMISFLAFPACSGSGGGFFRPDQSEVNFEFQDFIADLEDLVIFLDFFGLIDCADLSNLISQLVGTVACDDGGDSTITVENFVCDEGPPITASFTLAQSESNCQELGDVTNGVINGSVTFDGTVVNFNISSPGFTADGLTFTFAGFIVNINSSIIPSCSGTANVNGETCTASSDCTACTLN